MDKTGHQDFLLFPHCFRDLSFLHTGKITQTFHLKANNVGEENDSNQNFLLFLFFFSDFSHSGMKSRDCLGEETNIEKRNKTIHRLSLT